ncbi:phosphoadenosine phosphosulfate reductase family protein [Stenotrophomonas maltophilia]|uniref:phosphoadenosine phosphosulfate reductase domain-containing protein n=1 Tax=Stenotrophomonas geniculata TaxID=86188 RepID=UPI0018D42CED|nr:phosphoadenosine phosphosulfate reductase family protein [Stenotrophomonas maltophilia]
MISNAISRCAREIRINRGRSWIIGYSGGKDSTAALKVFLAASLESGCENDSITIIYCDTGVENPELDLFAKKTLEEMRGELPAIFPNLQIEILKAPLKEGFFVRVIGRGYAPPTNRFRWCTKGLRVLPVQRFINTSPGDAAVVLGLRFGESHQRDRSLAKGGNGGAIWQVQREGAQRDILLPVLDFDLEMVWAAAQSISLPSSIDSIALEELYRGATEECPMVKSPLAPPCASGRFGCWTCTVVRRDKSTESMIKNGKAWLQPYLDFRDWLQVFRGNSSYRWPVRRNGAVGPGPFTVEGRKIIFKEIQLLEEAVGREILSHDEIGLIMSLWEQDLDAETVLGLRN